jgi:hypothetical protein
MTYENFNNYIKVNVHKQWGIEDTPNNLIWTGDPSNHIEFYGCTNESCYCYNDKGIDAISDQEFNIDIKVASVENQAEGYFFVLANGINNVKALKDGGIPFVSMYVKTEPDSYGIYLADFTDGANLDIYGGGPFTEDTTYYLRIIYQRSTKQLQCRVYASDADRTADENIVKDLDLELNAEVSFRYIYAANTWFDGANYIAHFSQIDNLEFL